MFDLQTMKLFFALLTLATNVVVVGYAVVAVASRWSERAAGSKDQMHSYLHGHEILFGAIVSGAAMVGSLYLSEVAHLIPCTLCWYQRIAMYPLAIVLSIAALRRDKDIRIYALVLALIGGAIAIYHYMIQWFPNLEGTSCTSAIPCTAFWFRVFGFISIPYMALSAFLFVIVMMEALRSNTVTSSVGESE
jgi:disulfide bond formation protein DsbB